MGNSFELKIGMTTQEVLQNIGKLNTTAKTKQFIINFCNNDQDKKITNDIELAMLNSWANGSEKVKMPPKKPSGKGWETSDGVFYERTLRDSKGNGYAEETYDSQKRGDKKGRFTLWMYNDAMKYWDNPKKNPTIYPRDQIFDTNNDGYADYRVYGTDNARTGVSTFIYDNNLDGKPDKKEVERD